MDVKIVSKEGKHMEIELGGERHTFPNLLREVITQDPDVEFAAYNLDHPRFGTPKLYLKTNGNKKPEKVLSDALKKIRKDIAEFKAATTNKTPKPPKKK
ncbi:MAG: DNA-directed RNA polymerase subunit L [Candidatus Micrarchaeota archaeon]